MMDGLVKYAVLLQHMNKETDEAKIRGRLCTAAIFFDVLSGVLISLTVLELFSFQEGAVRSLQTTYVIWTFVIGLICFMTSLPIVLACWQKLFTPIVRPAGMRRLPINNDAS
jgi:formate/nitrite transporter FocA (FNT family)